METTYFGHNCETGPIFTKTVFLYKMSHIQLNLVFSCFKAFMRKLTEKFTFGAKYRLSQKEAKNYSKSYFFSTNWKMGKSLGKF